LKKQKGTGEPQALAEDPDQDNDVYKSKKQKRKEIKEKGEEAND